MEGDWTQRQTAWRASVLSGSEKSRRSYARSRSTRTVAAPDVAAHATRAACASGVQQARPPTARSTQQPSARSGDRASAGTTLRTMASPRAISSSNARAREPEARGGARREVDAQRVAGGRIRSRAEEDAVRHDDAGQRRVGLGREGAELGPPRLDESARRRPASRYMPPRDDRRASDGPEVELGVDDAHCAPLEHDDRAALRVRVVTRSAAPGRRPGAAASPRGAARPRVAEAAAA